MAGVGTYLRLARPKQWTKNLLVVAAPGAAGVLTEPSAVAKTGVAFLAFCMAAGGTYAWNDALDAESDRRHPTKCRRPVASGEISVGHAQFFGAVLLVAAVLVSLLASWSLALVVGGYMLLTVAYSGWLKHEPVLDLAAVAAGFVLRAIAGAEAVDVRISTWFLLVAASGSMYMVTGKRHAELLELGDDAADHRRSLAGYTRMYLLFVRAVASGVAIVAYALWSFTDSSRSGNITWFELSIVPFVLAILRYELLLEQGRGGAPEELVLSDRVLLVLGVMWVGIFAIAVYAK